MQTSARDDQLKQDAADNERYINDQLATFFEQVNENCNQAKKWITTHPHFVDEMNVVHGHLEKALEGICACLEANGAFKEEAKVV